MVEEETVDNETVDNETILETYILSWSDNFTYRQNHQDTRKYLQRILGQSIHYTWDNISIGNPDDMVTFTNSTFMNNTEQNFDNTFMNLGVYIVMVCTGLWVNVVGEMR